MAYSTATIRPAVCAIVIMLAVLLLAGPVTASSKECNSKSKGQDVEKAGKELAMKADKLSSYKNYNGAANVAASAADKYNLAALCFASTGDCKEATSAAALAKSAAQKSADIAKSSPNRGLTYAAERAMKAADAAQKSANSCK